jgi:hypothetical protein
MKVLFWGSYTNQSTEVLRPPGNSLFHQADYRA